MSATHYPKIQQAGFAVDVWHWPTVEDFRAHLGAYRHADTAPWARGCIVHHTIKPLASDWQGPRSMQGLARHYAVTMGWSAGPHLFIVSGAPKPEHDGIWQLTPLSVEGVHGNNANDWAWGVEVAGMYDRASWPPDVAALAMGAMAALLDWAGLAAGTATLQPHRQHNATKSCPGRAIDMAAVIRGTNALRRPPAPPAPTPGRYTADSPIIGSAAASDEALIEAFALKCGSKGSPYAAEVPDPIRTIIGPAYANTCRAAGVDLAIALAQCGHETGWLTSALSQRQDRDGRPLRNPAGIGVTAAESIAPQLGFVWDADRRMYRACTQFADWERESVPAHVGRLVAYATDPLTRTFAQASLAAKALAFRPLPTSCQGSAPTLRLLGTGPNKVKGCGWAGANDAQGLEYGASIAAAANILLALARAG